MSQRAHGPTKAPAQGVSSKLLAHDSGGLVRLSCSPAQGGET
jgi:hypothetical protein